MTQTPLARLSLENDHLTLRLRIFDKRMAADVVVPWGEVASAYRLKGHVLTPGVGFEIADGRTCYFWTWLHKARLLDALREHGVPVEAGARGARAVWRWRSFG